jgi:hypothetical protein
MLADARLDPPSSPFARSFPSRSESPSSTSLTVNYVPTKLSAALLSPANTGPYRRKGKGDSLSLPKQGGGVDAFRSGEARIGSRHDDEYDGIMHGYSRGKKKMKWTKFKWILLIANILVRRFLSSMFYFHLQSHVQLTIYSLIALVTCLLIWFNVFKHSDIILTANVTELTTSTVAAALGLFTCVIGWGGILLNNRAFLAVYTFLLWLVFAALVIPGYLSYKWRTFNLEGKVNSQWSRELGSAGRLSVQNELECCGYYNPFVEATVSASCYSRTVLPGCKQNFLDFEREVLKWWYISVFGLVPLHIFVMVSGLLCSNHVTYRFGKGLTPKAYRLDISSVAAIMDNYAKYVFVSLLFPTHLFNPSPLLANWRTNTAPE